VAGRLLSGPEGSVRNQYIIHHDGGIQFMLLKSFFKDTVEADGMQCCGQTWIPQKNVFKSRLQGKSYGLRAYDKLRVSTCTVKSAVILRAGIAVHSPHYNIEHNKAVAVPPHCTNHTARDISAVRMQTFRLEARSQM
jgi:hypothetical protein